MPYALMTHEWYQLGLNSLSVLETDWGWTQDRAHHHWMLARSLTEQEKNGNMIRFLSAFFKHHNCPLLKHCKNIYYSTILDVLFLYSVTQLLISALKMSRPARPPAHVLHMNELVNIQMTPQKNWHLERIDYKHLYNFMLTTEYFSSWCVGGGGFTDAGNLVWMHGEEIWMDFCEDCHLLSIPSPLTPSGCLLNLSPQRTRQINVFL